MNGDITKIPVIAILQKWDALGEIDLTELEDNTLHELILHEFLIFESPEKLAFMPGWSKIGVATIRVPIQLPGDGALALNRSTLPIVRMTEEQKTLYALQFYDEQQ